MTVQEIWNSGISFLNLCAVYYVIQLVQQPNPQPQHEGFSGDLCQIFLPVRSNNDAAKLAESPPSLSRVSTKSSTTESVTFLEQALYTIRYPHQPHIIHRERSRKDDPALLERKVQRLLPHCGVLPDLLNLPGHRRDRRFHLLPYSERIAVRLIDLLHCD